MENKRRYGYDNLRFFLIVCVVLGHLLELVSGKAVMPVQKFLYFLIYSFHIPALLFLSGCFSSFSWRRVAKLVGMYLVFQVAYLMFSEYALGRDQEIQFERPYWLLWYLMTLTGYSLLIPVLSRIPVRFAPVPVTVALVISLAVGFDGDIGYDYSLSRTLVFLPYFVLGHFAGRRKNKLARLLNQRSWVWPLAGAVALVMTVALYFGGVTKNMLYGSYAYGNSYGPMIRLTVLLTAMLWITALLGLFLTQLDRKLPLVSSVGRNTLPVYLLHGFAVRLIGKYNLDGNSILRVAVITVVLVVLLGLPWNVKRHACENTSGNPMVSVL